MASASTRLALRDSSGTFDAPFGGFIDVVVMVDRV
jgi:hypothetical protein